MLTELTRGREMNIVVDAEVVEYHTPGTQGFQNQQHKRNAWRDFFDGITKLGCAGTGCLAIVVCLAGFCFIAMLLGVLAGA